MAENKRQQQKNSTRKHLIETAINLFGVNGITTTRTVDIAKAAEVSHGTLFSHFPTLEELLIAVIEEFGNRIAQRLHELVNENCSLLEILEAHLTSLIEFEPFYIRLVIERRLLPKEVTNTYIMIQSTISHHICIASERELEQGVIRRLPVHMIYNTWVGLIHYYLTNSDLFSSDGRVLEHHSKELLKHYISLIKI
jgi:TetR/AcrR family transcriptional regulator, acrEF/envCD operon repressor